MTVKELIEELEKIEDKSRIVYCGDSIGRAEHDKAIIDLTTAVRETPHGNCISLLY